MKKKIFALLTIGIMFLIFYFSMENSSESSSRSGTVTEFILKLFIHDYKEMSISEKKMILKEFEHIIRKLAHFSIYTALGFLASLTIGRHKFISTSSFIVLIFGFLYACSDEFHQYFVPGRACQFKDVLIDTMGVIAGIIISMVAFSIYNTIKNKLSKSSY